MPAPTERAIVELVSLPERHGDVGFTLLQKYRPEIVHRMLRGESYADSPPRRNIAVSWKQRSGERPQEEVLIERVLSWLGIEKELANVPRQLTGLTPSVNREDISERAAIVVMALLVHDLEQLIVESVIPIGEGADYIGVLLDRGRPFSVEVSGITEVERTSRSVDILRKKTNQLLKDNESGFVSVTTFSYPSESGPIVHSYLHFVSRTSSTATKPRTGRKASKKRSGNMPTAIRPDKRASREGIMGDGALRDGDTIAARKHHDAAGKILIDQAMAARGAPEKHLYFFLAATQFYLGGNYQRSLEIARRIEARHLPSRHRTSFDKMFNVIRERSNPTFAHKIRINIFEIYQNGDYKRALTLLTEYPYYFDRIALAFCRSDLCHRLGDIRAAASFLERAVEFGLPLSEALGISFESLELRATRGIDEAWNAARTMAEVFPDASTELVACLALNDRVISNPAVDRIKNRRLQIEFCQRAWSRISAIQPDVSKLGTERDVIALAAASCSIAALEVNDLDIAQSALDIVERINPKWGNMESILKRLKTTVEQSKVGDTPSDPLEATSFVSQIEVLLKSNAKKPEKFIQSQAA